ncbi:tRNA lysidine(34) synthetase TilS [Nocardia sp. SYP-A9097]|uniref:tRNA lysidine(34) synthetase TilS n=1 Tax=Nocardia sp. SYP-A9097 TaxID=2663237 RepID=UPI00129BFBCB|nr:tRNA lysidine(34) synthetase TilS [Nocardia sp. SYP-A9097]MRH90447.1 tRNA lysidine(34) synthetase TilS [Nocardia sp. SYP-A9097]
MRHAVRDWLGRFAPDGVVAVGLSGGADSLALTATAAVEAEVVDAYIVDHGLQDGSAEVAARAAEVALRLGCRSARVLTVEVGTEGGLEAAARRARYAALDAARFEPYRGREQARSVLPGADSGANSLRPGMPVLLGHTLDDQAETVLLGLARGSGGRSIQGMTEYAEPWGRPLLGVRRNVTRQLCADLGLTPWEDPHNTAPEFTRVRLRTEVLPLLEEVLGGGVAAALARTAAQLREDGATLDALAENLLNSAIDGEALILETLTTVAPALRRRVIRAWLLGGGAKSLTDSNLRAVEALVTDWRGQGGVAVGGSVTGTRLVAAREHGRLILTHSEPDRGRHHH